MQESFWDTQLDYLRDTRRRMWNDDYFAFLVKSVWKLDKPVNIVDFGCGYGFLGMKLMPLLPEDSTYTGLDMSGRLLCEGKRIFQQSPYQAVFIEADLMEYIPRQQYDVAICQAVLRHIPAAERILQKMIDSVVPMGKVICIEVNRVMEEAGLYINQGCHDSIDRLASSRKDWQNEWEGGGRDYRLGSKVPIYMQQRGLKDVGVRVNDFVDLISPLSDEHDYEKRRESISHEKGLEDPWGDDAFILRARCLLISYGTKQNVG